MNILQVDIVWLILILFSINIFFILALKGGDRFYLPAIGVWMFLFCAALLNNYMNQREIEYSEAVIKHSESGNEMGLESITWYELEQSNKKKQKENNTYFYLLGFQTILTFFFQLIGFAATRLKFYRSAAVAFGILVIIFIIVLFNRL